MKINNQRKSRTYFFVSMLFLFIVCLIGFPSHASAQGTPGRTGAISSTGDTA